MLETYVYEKIKSFKKARNELKLKIELKLKPNHRYSDWFIAAYLKNQKNILRQFWNNFFSFEDHELMDKAAQDDQGSKHRMITKMFNLCVFV